MYPRMMLSTLTALLSVAALPLGAGETHAGSAPAADAAPGPLLPYQGRLLESGAPVSGARAFVFSIQDATGTELWNSGAQNLTVNGGLYSITLGGTGMPALPVSLPGRAGLRLHILESGTALTPDIDIVPAMQARSAWDFMGALAGDISGTQLATSVDKLKGLSLDFSMPPAPGQVLTFNGASWVPSTVSTGIGAPSGVSSVGAVPPLASSGGSTPQISLSGTIPVSNGGTGATSLTGFLMGHGSGALTGVSLIPGSSVSGNIPGNAAGLTGVLPMNNGGTGANAFHAGAIPFSIGSSLSSDYTNLFWDATNKRLGLGTSTPTQQLTLTGNIDMRFTTPGLTTGGLLMINGSPLLSSYPTNVPNIYLGSSAGNLTTTGIGNVGIGSRALALMSTGSHSVGVGENALTTLQGGSDNVAIGNAALGGLLSGDFNVVLGSLALNLLGSGSSNTCVGFGAGNGFLGNGTSDNVLLGAGAGNALDPSSHKHLIIIGSHGIGPDTNLIRIGDSNQTKCYIAGIWGNSVSGGATVLADSNGHLGTIVSSRRYKDDIRDMGDASSRIFDLRPVTFRYKDQKASHFGLIAEEVQETLPELAVKGVDGQVETVAYHELPPLLLNELQKQRSRVITLEAENAALKMRLDSLEQAVARLGEK